MDITWIGSPNYSRGRHGYRPEAIVVHIMEGTLSGTDAWFRNRDSGVSAHYGIGLTGEVHQYVHEADAAWHAGRKSSDAPWALLKSGVNPNRYTIGIEHEGYADDAWSDAMLAASARLIKEVALRWGIPIDRRHVIGHREIYTVKTCPGRGVSLPRLVREAKALALDRDEHNWVRRRGSVTTRSALNLRAAPTTAARRVGRAKRGARLAYTGWTSSGEAVHGNAHWYRTARGQYFWAGGTSAPIPGVA